MVACRLAYRASAHFPDALLPFNAPMPRSGAYVISDLPRDRLCRIACQRCGPLHGLQGNASARAMMVWLAALLGRLSGCAAR
jgi:hypothetical protein